VADDEKPILHTMAVNLRDPVRRGGHGRNLTVDADLQLLRAFVTELDLARGTDQLRQLAQ